MTISDGRAERFSVVDRLAGGMHEPILELLPELLPEIAATAFYGVGALVLSGLAVVLEEVGFQTAAAGQPKLGLWIAVFGAILLYLGAYGMGYKDFLPRARALATRLRA